MQPIFVSGKVVVEGGSDPGEPVAIERVCNGVSRREGYTDFKGQFEFQIGVNPTFQDASENGIQSAPNVPTQIGSTLGGRRPADLTGCEYRAALAGFLSTSVLIPSAQDSRYELGTIFLKRMGDAKGTTVSMTSMAAPKNAKQAYERAERANGQKKYSDAEKELSKAVKVYPQFAAAWSLMGEIHQQQGQFQQAREEYEKALAADPQYVNPIFGLAMIAVQEKNWPEAIRITGQLIQLNGYAFPAAYFYNAAANYNTGNMEAAEGSARKYKTLDTDHRHPDIALLLGNILIRKKDYAGAAQQVRDYLAVVPNPPNAANLQEQLKQLDAMSTASKN
jgi:tetratricopeptide (TPR) repeat protein